MTFRIGQKVVCVDVSPHPVHGRPTAAKLRHIYTVTGVYSEPVSRDGQGVTLAEIAPLHALIGFLGHRFRPIVERKTDISVFTEILRKATKPARTPSLAQQDRQT